MAQKETIKGVQVVRFLKDYAHYEKTKNKRNTYVLNDTELEKILMNEEIKDLPVAVVSVAGVLRSGKSFLLNYFLRFLSATPSARMDGSWLGVPGQQLTGFDWEPGNDRTTTGILIWPQPFVIQIPSGERVAVLLMDTQGTFDLKSSTRDNSTIFALSTLLSSTQIYNLKEKITQSDLMHLELFTSYGAMMKHHTGKSFQELKFLIRDWEHDWQYQFGEDGGESYKKKELQIEEPEELVKICKHINDSFERVSCFLMPRPCNHVAKPAFKENPGKLEPEFEEALIKLVHAIFDSNRLCMKRLGGQPVRCRELFDHFKTYVSMFNSDDLPEPKTVLQALSETGLLMASNATIELFEKNVSRECALSMPAAELMELHNQQVELSLASFESKRLFGDSQNIANKREEIRKELTKRLDEMLRTNNAKTNTAVTNATAAYDAVIVASVQDRKSSEYALNMKQAHQEALIAALRVFDKNRKILSPDKTDFDRQGLLKAQCKAGLLIVANAAREQFKNNISRECALSMPEEELRELHDQQLKLALAPFEGEHLFRDVTSTYQEIKTELTKSLDELLVSNNAKLMTAVTNGIAAYDVVMQTSAQDKQSYEYALKLKNSHEEALEAAMRVFDENKKTLSSGKTDPDRQSFYKAQCKAGLLEVAKAAREQFENNMSRECALSMPAEELRELHNQQLELALAPFEGNHSFGVQQDVTSKKEEIAMELNNRLDEMLESNNNKTMIDIRNSRAVYNNVMETLLAQHEQPHEHALNLKQAHEAALVAATCFFDENRKTLAADKTDPDRQEFLEVQCEAGLLMVAIAAREQFENNMSRECELSMPADELLELHNHQLELTLALFQGNHSFGNQQEVTNIQETIRLELTNRLEEMSRLNNARTMEAMTNGIAAYEAVIETLAGEQLLCVHTQDLAQAHEEARSSAITNVFDENRKTLAAGKTDPDRQEFLEQCDAAYENYTQINISNNRAISSDVLNEYHRCMISHCSQVYSEAEFRAHHESALANALEEFESRRNRPNQYPEDAFKDALVEDINFHYLQYQQMNASNNADLLELARSTYFQESITLAELQNSCLHPDDLQQIHNDAVARALHVFRPRRPASEGFPEDNLEERAVKNMIMNHLTTIVEINHRQNESAKNTAFDAYKRKYAMTRMPSSSIFDGPRDVNYVLLMDNHEEAFRVARDAFYEKRRRPRNVTTEITDRYFSELNERCIGYSSSNLERERNNRNTSSYDPSCIVM